MATSSIGKIVKIETPEQAEIIARVMNSSSVKVKCTSVIGRPIFATDEQVKKMAEILSKPAKLVKSPCPFPNFPSKSFKTD